jgi:hypothetical protein
MTDVTASTNDPSGLHPLSAHTLKLIAEDSRPVTHRREQD